MPDTNPIILQRLNACVTKRETIFSQLQVTFNLVKKVSTDASAKAIFMARCATLETLKQEFKKINDGIADLSSECCSDSEKIDSTKPMLSFDELYYVVKATHTSLLEAEQKAKPNSNSQPSVGSSARLPKINIPTFNGSLNEWTNFISLYDSLIHNGDYPKLVKFTYLRSLLSGSPLQLISNIELTEANYDLAYLTIVERYKNKRLLAAHHLNKIMQFKPLNNDSYNDLMFFLTVFHSNMEAFKNLALENPYDFILFHWALKALPSNVRDEFEKGLKPGLVPTFEQLIKFVEALCRVKELSLQDKGENKMASYKPKFMKSLVAVTNSNNNSKPENVLFKCPVCSSSSHKIYACPKFKNIDVGKKYDLLKNLNRCFGCLGAHSRNECSSKGTCSKCHSSKHHTLLHKSSYDSIENSDGFKPSQLRNNSVTSQRENQAEGDQKVLTSSVLTTVLKKDDIPNSSGGIVLLATAQASMVDSRGGTQPIRLVVDSGSQVNCITASCVQRLGLRVNRSPLSVSGISGNPVLNAKGVVNCTLLSRIDTSCRFSINAIVLNHICSALPTISFSSEILEKLNGIKLADKCLYEKGEIDFLLGVELFAQIIQSGFIRIENNLTCLQTKLGWIVMGQLPIIDSHSHTAVSLLVSENSVEKMIQRFWEVEEVGPVKISDPEDALCESHFSDTFARNDSGAFVVRLPFRNSTIHPPFGDSRTTALRRWQNLESRLIRQGKQQEIYYSQLAEYLSLNHMEVATTSGVHFLPHFAVNRDSSITTKVRIVFDASCKDSSGLSLNDRLLTGPKLQNDISLIMTLFRLKSIGLSADIKMMYRCIWMHPQDQQFQHIFGRCSSQQQVQEYVLKTLTFGLNCAPFIAQRCMRQLAIDDGKDFPLAAEALTESIFMDDFVISANSKEEALQLKTQLISLLGRAQFNLRKWACTSEEVLADVAADSRADSLSFSDSNKDIPILGLEWDPRQDHFSYKIVTRPEAKTKRAILSNIASLYDPLGWISPVTFYAKSFIQQLWLSGCSWDEEIPENLLIKWSKLVSRFYLLREIKIPRFILFQKTHSVQLVGFCDASELGYSATVYLRCVSADQRQVKSNLLKAKTKVAPLKTLSIPRLELNGAVLLAKLFESLLPVRKKLSIEENYFFTDSTVVLAWIKTPPHLLKTYVANRIAVIQEITSPSNWGHVPTEMNPADCASRGLLPDQISGHSLWWAGPEYLTQPINEWPSSHALVNYSDLPETKNTVSVLQVSQDIDASDQSPEDIFRRFSSLTRLQRVVAWIFRFYYNVRSRQARCLEKSLSISEIRQSLTRCVKLTQYKYYPDDIIRLKKGLPCSKSLRSLSPFLDKDGLLRVGGRLRHSNLQYTSKHPALLSSRSLLASLVCNFNHLQSLHGGPQLVQALIQKQFWIPSLRSCLRKVIFQCAVCYRLKAKSNFPPMADLPAARFSTQRAFKISGVDMAGPFQLKEHTRRNARISKAYLCLFICMSTKAVHLELTSDLTAVAYQAALERFIARRGLCSDIYCDNGTNFVGASRTSKEIVEFLKKSFPEIKEHLTMKSITYHFIPPGAPWFGGLWEAAIKSVKHHLLRSVSNRPLTYEEMLTFLTRVEAVLNSRPLCSLSSDPHDGTDYLSPGHFLIGTSLLSPPEHDLSSIPDNHLSRWQFVQQALQTFWKRWSSEYLHQLMQRKKWTTPRLPLSKGDVVYILSENTSPLDWPIGRIEELYPGKDGVTRVAKVRTTKGTYLRPVAKLVELPAP